MLGHHSEINNQRISYIFRTIKASSGEYSISHIHVYILLMMPKVCEICMHRSSECLFVKRDPPNLGSIKGYLISYRPNSGSSSRYVMTRDGLIPPSQVDSYRRWVETGLTINIVQWDWHNIYPTFHQNGLIKTVWLLWEGYLVTFHKIKKKTLVK